MGDNEEGKVRVILKVRGKDVGQIHLDTITLREWLDLDARSIPLYCSGALIEYIEAMPDGTIQVTAECQLGISPFSLVDCPSMVDSNLPSIIFLKKEGKR